MIVTTMTPRYCSANCGVCGSQVIDNSDGLPVELMGFAIEGEDPDGGEDREPSPAPEKDFAPGSG